MRISRWRPVCPECGYPLRGLTAPRCPECGVDFPTNQKTFRRWANHRLPWDRLDRGSIVPGYLRTLALMLFMPWQAGRRLVIPDRWGRAVRWAAIHLAATAVLGTMLGTSQYYVWWIRELIWPSSFRHPVLFSARFAPADRSLIWLCQSLSAWVMLLLALITVGILISWCFPGRHNAARLGGIKWSLYIVPILLVPLGAWYGYYRANPPMHWSGLNITLPMPTVDADLLAAAYGLWWAAGMAGNLYGRHSRVRAYLLFGGLYAACWILLTRGLFPVEAMEDLL